MLVVPALMSLKAQVIDEASFTVKSLIEEVIARLRDPAEIVAKTARKLICELHKCYPVSFETNFIAPLANESDRIICSLILNN